MTIGEVFLLAVVGVLAGSINGVVGGGTLMSFPLLLALGVPPVSASATNTVALVPGYLSGAAIHRRELTARDTSMLLPLVIAAGLGAVVGALALVAFPERVFAALVPWLILGATLLFVAQPWIARRLPPPAPGERGSPPILLVSVGLAGVYGAYFGGALGVLLLAVLGIEMALPLRRLNAVRAIMSLTTNVVAFIVLVAVAPIAWLAASALAPASFVGGIYGAQLARRMPPTLLRAVVVIIGLTTALALLLR